MGGKNKHAKTPAHEYYPGSEIDIQKIEKQVESHFRHGIKPSAAIFLVLSIFLLIVAFLISPLLQVMAEYYLSPQQASSILKMILPYPSPGQTYPALYEITKKLTIILPIAAFFSGLIGLLFHIKTKGIGMMRRRKKARAKR